jgi:hypothetical protein
VLLYRIHRIDLFLNHLRWHRGIEDQNIRSERRLRALRCKHRQSRCQKRRRKAKTR